MIPKDDKPDFTAEELYSVATLPQQDTVEKMKPYGWRVSHLWRRGSGDIVVWMITRAIGGYKGWSQAYIEADGKLVRYKPDRITLPGKGKNIEEYR